MLCVFITSSLSLSSLEIFFQTLHSCKCGHINLRQNDLILCDFFLQLFIMIQEEEVKTFKFIQIILDNQHSIRSNLDFFRNNQNNAFRDIFRDLDITFLEDNYHGC
ncbi:hypothetical protein DERP_011184 [Dermatophagoides pteronyssinus]|uniref:Uncharacterized protein n=1 Tax=Dermatophagoides pteronyssinus TaxID=6956 RepID=A0ABQ8JCD9_DERPT|nr:hypothetical protein DERP_011184 [Dermatophagoides pteronyssinus]